ncbi:hypothetical protein BOX15_Mlig000523g2, partial [Macrostomum lignano]
TSIAMAEVGNLLDFGTPDEQNQAQAAIEPNTDNLLDFANNEDSAIESQSALPDLEAEPTETTTEAAEPQEQLTELVEGEEREADVCETVEEAQSPLEPAESGTVQQQEQQQDPIIELDSPNPADTSGMAEQQQQQGDEPAAIDFGSILSADGQSVANNEEVKVDVDADVDVRADASVFDNRQYEVESSGGGVEISLRPKSEHDWSTSTKSVAMQYSNSTHNSSGNATAEVSSQSRNSFNGSPGDVCRLCQKKVYPMEQLTSDGHVYHKSCYRCHKCNRLLSVGNFGVLDNQLYCQPHYLEIFRMRGHYQASADRPAAEIVGRDNPVDDGISQVQKLSNLKSRFESSGDSSVVVTPPSSGGHHPTPGSRNGAHSDPPADVVRSGDAVPAEGELPPPGASKSVLAMFRNLETGGQQPAKDQQQQPGRLKGAVAPTQRRPYQPQPNMDFDYTAPVRSAAESESSPVERPPDVVRSGDPNPADELPPANFTRSALQMWKNKEVEGGKVAPNPETSERLRQRARETSGVNNNIRLPGAASVGVSGSRDSDDAERPSSPQPQPRDESSENEPSVPPADVARWGAGDGNDEMPKQGITQNLRSMFSGGQ